jgi:hypothetical protein
LKVISMRSGPKPNRSAAIYILTGLMLLIMLLFGGFFAVWCGTLRFIFSGTGWRALALLVLPGFIAWRAFDAARDAWDGLPSAPPTAIVTLLCIQLLIGLAQFDAYLSGDVRGISLPILAPHALLFGLIALTFWLSPQFNQHRFESDQAYLPAQEAPAQHDDDDDDALYLGGA